jgi:NAD-dependent dihydropyrimidine dehydrogenase PreA subunit
MTVRIDINYDKLGDDTSALDVCPMGVFELKDGKVVAAHPENCIVCRACEASAPPGAIHVNEE